MAWQTTDAGDPLADPLTDEERALAERIFRTLKLLDQNIRIANAPSEHPSANDWYYLNFEASRHGWYIAYGSIEWSSAFRAYGAAAHLDDALDRVDNESWDVNPRTGE